LRFAPCIIISSRALRRPQRSLVEIKPVANSKRVAHAPFIDRVIVRLHLRVERAGAFRLDVHMPECVKHKRNTNRIFSVSRFERTIFRSVAFRAEAIPIFDQQAARFRNHVDLIRIISSGKAIRAQRGKNCGFVLLRHICWQCVLHVRARSQWHWPRCRIAHQETRQQTATGQPRLAK
jgi:hypothetical protein